MLDTVLNIMYVTYFVFSYLQTAPCVIKLLRTKHSNDYSLQNRLFQFIATVCWTGWAICTNLNSFTMISLAVLDFALLTLENLLILKYYNKENKNVKKENIIDVYKLNTNIKETIENDTVEVSRRY
mgnify:CR=1 FL=1